MDRASYVHNDMHLGCDGLSCFTISACVHLCAILVAFGLWGFKVIVTDEQLLMTVIAIVATFCITIFDDVISFLVPDFDARSDESAYMYLSIGAVGIAYAVYLGDKLDEGGFGMTVAVVVTIFCIFILGDLKQGIQSDSRRSMKQILIVTAVFLCVFLVAVVTVFMFSWWAIRVGITAHELTSDLDTVDTDVHTTNTIVIANALIWTSTLLMLSSYVISRIGFQMSRCAKVFILYTIEDTPDAEINKSGQSHIKHVRYDKLQPATRGDTFVY